MTQFYFQLILSLHCGSVYVLSVIYHLHPTNGFTTTAPSSPPMDLQAVVGERRLNLAWSPPSPPERNGVITGYKVICTASGLASFSSETAQLRLIVIPLVPYTAYKCCVLALTAAGTGPSICQSFKTKEAGESVHSPFLFLSTYFFVNFDCYFSSKAPAASPTGFKHTIMNGMAAVEFKWSILPKSKSNGVIIQYILSCSSLSPSSLRVMDIMLNTTITRLMDDSLSPGTFYQCTISASTAAGEGPASQPPLKVLTGKEEIP